VEELPYENAYGAHWERSMVTWDEPDGTHIVAFEASEFNQGGELNLISFESKEYLDQKAAGQAKPNPYK
jgi:hypothetical protein